jgi:ectoine hydroxylase-related dioxygenase (phytanoyl-CoA dioxygenase family)
MIICKQPEIGGAVPPHQDSTFLYTEPPSAVGFWYAMEDATVSNGCLSFAAGTHKSAPITTRFVRKDSGGVDMAENQGAKFPAGLEVAQSKGEPEYIIGEVKAGSLVLIHGNILHKSEKNLSNKSRYICKYLLLSKHRYLIWNRYFSRNRRRERLRCEKLATTSCSRLHQAELNGIWQCKNEISVNLDS